MVHSNVDTPEEPVIIKKYANRRLYNTDTSSYVTLDDLAEMVKSERDFVVYDAKSGEDLTRAVLTQIIVEQESSGQNLLPIKFLRQLIRFYGASIERLVPSYLELSLDSLTKEQDRIRKQFSASFGTTALDAMQGHAMQNIAMFEKALAMFTPFAGGPYGNERSAEDAIRGRNRESCKREEPSSSGDDIETLKSEMTAMQQKLDELSRRSG